MKGHMDSELSPFVGGAVVILSNLFVNSSVLSPATKQFLEKFGVHIRRLVIIQGEEERQNGDFDIVGFVNCVKKCLLFVPNLEKLLVKCNSLSEGEAKNKLDQWRVKVLLNEVLEEPTPKLSKLETLGFEYFKTKKVDQVCGLISNGKPWPYLEQIFGDIMILPYYRTQLKQLGLGRANRKSEFEVVNLKELSIANLKCKLSEMKIRAPVQKLTLIEYRKYDDDVAKAFPDLGYLRVDKKSLDFCLHERNSKSWNKTKIHTLEILEVEVDEDSLFPKLASAFPHLRHLIIRNLTKIFEPTKTNWIPDFFCEDDPLKHLMIERTSYDTDLWKLLPELKVFTFQFRKYVPHEIPEAKDWGAFELAKEKEPGCPFKNIVETRQGYRLYTERKVLSWFMYRKT